MIDTARIAAIILATCLAAGCGKSEAPPAAAAAPEAKAEPPKDGAAPAAKPLTTLVMPDACALLDASDYLDAADPSRVIKVAIAYGALILDDSANYAEIVGDREGTLKHPATPVTTFGIPTIEMDAGPGAQSMQTRFEPTTELTVTTPTLQITRVPFPRALIKLRALPELQNRNVS